MLFVHSSDKSYHPTVRCIHKNLCLLLRCVTAAASTSTSPPPSATRIVNSDIFVVTLRALAHAPLRTLLASVLIPDDWDWLHAAAQSAREPVLNACARSLLNSVPTTPLSSSSPILSASAPFSSTSSAAASAFASTSFSASSKLHPQHPCPHAQTPSAEVLPQPQVHCHSPACGGHSSSSSSLTCPPLIRSVTSPGPASASDSTSSAFIGQPPSGSSCASDLLATSLSSSIPSACSRRASYTALSTTVCAGVHSSESLGPAPGLSAPSS